MAPTDLYHLLRQQDPDLALLSLFAPRDRRTVTQAIFLFHTDISRIRHMVTDTNLGLIRLQWWRDALQGPVINHPYLSYLQQDPEMFPHLDAALYAREFDLMDTLPADIAGVIAYADYTHTPILQAICLDTHADALRPLAIAWGITHIIQHVVRDARQGLCLLPQDHLNTANIQAAKIYTGHAIPHLAPVIALLVKVAQDHLMHSKMEGLPQAMQRLLRLRLRQMECAGYDPSQSSYHAPLAFMALRVALGLV